MNIRSALIATSAGVVAFGIALPASAYALPGATTATITISGGSLSISVPTDADNHATVTNTVSGETASGRLGQVQEIDARNAAAGSGWVASVISTAFTPGAGAAIAASAVGYTVGPIT